MTTFKEMWSELQRPGKPMPFLLIDCAGIDGGAAQIPRYIFSEIQCLFVGNLETEMADVAPYLGQLKSLDSAVSRTVENLLSKHICILVILKEKPINGFDISFSQLYRHFRKLNTVKGPQGNQIFFRYYDPRVIVNVLTVMDQAQVSEFLGPIQCFAVAGSNRTVVTWRRRDFEQSLAASNHA